jgi:hypothetical protein
MDDVTALLQEARAAGLKVEADGDRLLVRGPKAAELVALKLGAHKPAILAALASGRWPAPEPPAPTADPDAFGPPLAAAGVAVGFKVPGIEPELFLVADEEQAAILAEEGIARGRCWTPGEIRMVAIPTLTPAHRQQIARVKVEMEGVLGDPSRATWPAHIPGLGPQETSWPLSEQDEAGVWVRAAAPWRCGCSAETWVRYGEEPLCLTCATARR